MRVEELTYKAWFDGSTSHHMRRSGIGGIIVSPDNKIVLKYSVEIPYIKSSQKVEYVALIRLLIKLQELGIKNVKIKTDNRNICIAVSNRKSRMKLYKKAITILDQIPHCMIVWIPRKENRYADKLSRMYKNRKRTKSNCLDIDKSWID